MTKQTIILIVIIAILLGGIAGYAINSSNDRWDSDEISMGMHRMPDGSLMGNTPTGNTGMGMMGGMDHSMMMVSSEREFIQGMIPHHQEAVDTAKEVIARGGTTPEIRTLAENIIVAQEKEIADMKMWYQSWYGEAYTDTDTYEPMMRELENLSGATLDRVFLEDMIMHHMGAIMMAQSVQPYIEHQEMETLTRAIVSSQSKEIAEMRQMLQGL